MTSKMKATTRRTRIVRVEPVDAAFLDRWHEMPRFLRQGIRRYIRAVSKWDREPRRATKAREQ